MHFITKLNKAVYAKRPDSVASSTTAPTSPGPAEPGSSREAQQPETNGLPLSVALPPASSIVSPLASSGRASPAGLANGRTSPAAAATSVLFSPPTRNADLPGGGGRQSPAAAFPTDAQCESARQRAPPASARIESSPAVSNVDFNRSNAYQLIKSMRKEARVALGIQVQHENHRPLTSDEHAAIHARLQAWFVSRGWQAHLDLLERYRLDKSRELGMAHGTATAAQPAAAVVRKRKRNADSDLCAESAALIITDGGRTRRQRGG